MSTTTPRLTRTRRGAGAILLASLALTGGGAMAQQAWPAKPIQVIVPLQVGSAADVATRVVVARMGENMKQTFIVENHAGVSGLLGAERVARAAPDGYTLGGITDSVLNYAVNLSDKVSFDPLNDFAPVSQMANIAWVLVANSGFGAKTVPELLAQARARPGKIDYATAGIGSPHHIAMELFAAGNGASFAHVPYKGATQATTDVAGGQLPMMFSAVSVALPFIKDGRLRALAQPNEQRSALLPDVPTFAEAGAHVFRFSTWLGLYAPKGTPADIVERLHAEVAKAVADPAVRERLAALGLEPVSSTPAELGALTREGYARVGQAIRSAGIKPQ
ncbi:Bug family tripartite tricarboxylate transporter substrate binding protein [Bordetella genomosp. 13]|nr:tripartite tricarboxylate transporter substrate binding protein [Bordetella genomosp. 13]